MNKTENIYDSIVADLEGAGRESAYQADATEPDARYKSYGVRADGKKRIIGSYKSAIRSLETQEQLGLAQKLIESEYGEQQSVGLFILEPFAYYFSPGKFEELDNYVRHLHGWSKIDSFTGSLLRDVLFLYPDEFVNLVRSWNQDEDLWLRRASVVLFTRKVAMSGRFNDIALELCGNLVDDPELLVQKGVGWSLKDLMRNDKERIANYVIELRARGVSSTITLYAIKDLKGEERAAILDRTKSG
jgi:3-methyladenine DNA glycosylase AlkD